MAVAAGLGYGLVHMGFTRFQACGNVKFFTPLSPEWVRVRGWSNWRGNASVRLSLARETDSQRARINC